MRTGGKGKGNQRDEHNRNGWDEQHEHGQTEGKSKVAEMDMLALQVGFFGAEHSHPVAVRGGCGWEAGLRNVRQRGETPAFQRW